MKTARIFLLIFAAAAPAFSAGPTWDSSGNSQLNGTYYFRQVLYVGGTGGSISQAVTVYGNLNFSGSAVGSYTISGATLVISGSSPQTYAPAAGTYSVSASGYGFMSSPLASVFPTGVANGNLYFLVSNGILVGSETESGYNDVLIAAPLSTSLSLASFQGAYTISGFFPGGSPATSLGGTYQLNPNGAGSLGNVSISGYSGAGATYSQNSSGVKYAYSNGAYSITFPTNNSAFFYQGGTIGNTNGDNGPVFLYMSPDGNFVFGGSTLGFDIFVGVKNVSSGASTPLAGLYYETGFDDNETTGLDSYYGSFNAYQGVLIGHERLLVGGSTAYGDTYSTNYPTSISGTYSDSSNTVNYTFAQDGIRIGYGTGGFLGINVALPYSPPAASRSVYIDPTGLVNTASTATYTAGVSPGEFVTLYNGVNLANSTVVAPPGAFPTSLGGVSVIIDGILKAPLYYVSPTSVSFLIPYEVSTFPIASIEVNNNGATSNIATTYVNLTAPGVFTYNTGVGDAALIDYPSGGGSPYFINENNPAQPGDTVVVFLSGLGAPFPTNPDGALGVADFLVQTIGVDVNGVAAAAPAYAGLAPELAGLYQINFTVPSGPFCPTTAGTPCMTAGDNSLGITGPDSYTFEATIPIREGTAAAVAGTSPEAKPATRGKVLPRLNKSANR
jgi:uncharacterized protein (TIGR03437 family)